VLYANGTGVAMSNDTAIILYRKACQLGEGLGCTNLATRVGEQCSGILYERGCQLGGGKACALLATTARHRSPPDEESATAYDDRGCKLNQGGSCFNVGLAYARGKGAALVPGLAAKYYARACDLDNAAACLNYGILIEKGETGGALADAVAQYQKSCALKDDKGCQNLTRASGLQSETRDGKCSQEHFDWFQRTLAQVKFLLDATIQSRPNIFRLAGQSVVVVTEKGTLVESPRFLSSEVHIFGTAGVGDLQLEVKNPQGYLVTRESPYEPALGMAWPRVVSRVVEVSAGEELTITLKGHGCAAVAMYELH
jgi:hypothetical protein